MYSMNIYDDVQSQYVDVKSSGCDYLVLDWTIAIDFELSQRNLSHGLLRSHRHSLGPAVQVAESKTSGDEVIDEGISRLSIQRLS
jgi:hypothetical protein